MIVYSYFLSAFFIFMTGAEIQKDHTCYSFGTYLMILPLIGRILGWW